MYVIIERVEYIAELGRLMRSVLLRKNTAYGTILSSEEHKLCLIK